MDVDSLLTWIGYIAAFVAFVIGVKRGYKRTTQKEGEVKDGNGE